MNVVDKLNQNMNFADWYHPEFADYAQSDIPFVPIASVYCNPSIPFEERQKKFFEDTASMEGGIKELMKGNGEELKIPGCPEEPDTQASISVARPTNARSKKLPCIMVIPGGGLYNCFLGTHNAPAIADEFKAVVVNCSYRTIFTGGGYPQTINDLHAAYKWIVDNAEELGVNPDKIVIRGNSSGGHLALALCHRLKKYNYTPRGCFAEVPVPDERTIYPSSRREAAWGGREVHATAQAWLGPEYACSAYVPAEAFANHATIEDCVGLPPTFIHTGELEVSADPDMVYASKLIAAGVHTELHIWGGMGHSGMFMSLLSPEDQWSETTKQYNAMRHRQITECFEYDLRRPWVKDLLADEK